MPQPFYEVVVNLAHHQLISIHEKRPEYREAVEREWKWRNGTDYPYSLNGQLEIMHKGEIAREVPEDIKKQAERVREKIRWRYGGKLV